LRLYYDSTARASQLAAAMEANPLGHYYLYSNESNLFLDAVPASGTTAKYMDSAGVNFAGRNPWKEIGAWRVTVQ
jgi:hypothetical protein